MKSPFLILRNFLKSKTVISRKNVNFSVKILLDCVLWHFSTMCLVNTLVSRYFYQNFRNFHNVWSNPNKAIYNVPAIGVTIFLPYFYTYSSSTSQVCFFFLLKNGSHFMRKAFFHLAPLLLLHFLKAFLLSSLCH